MLLSLTALDIKDERHLKSFTGVDLARFEVLLEAFSQHYTIDRQSRVKGPGKRKRKAGGGRKSRLPKMEDKLAFILHYHKVYPTFDNLASTFGMSRSAAFGLLHGLAPVLKTTLEALQVLPKRKLADTEAFLKHLKELGDIDQLLIDVTERPHRRLSDPDQRDALYSGKKSDSR